ncbi:MAG: hypothetical protein D6718_05565 [Acidobacteria bacterium]|nr:MAG: hypothetical protein D6718_05565 [Acidobacteriota bacterium]
MTQRHGLMVRCLLAAAVVAAAAAVHAQELPEKRLIVLGFDGMDYELTSRLLAEGKLPNLARVARSGLFRPLGTAIPPQSPVAWSDFTTGMDAGGHGIFDFLHRDPLTYFPKFSTSTVESGDGPAVRLGCWRFPLWGGETKLLRHGKPFWQVLEDHGIETTVVRMPANFPPSGLATRELSGMGTPDLMGGYGEFSFYTTDPSKASLRVSGGAVYAVAVEDGVIHAALHGPENPLYTCGKADLEAPFTVYLDPDEEVVKLVVGDEERLLRAGEWSDWVPVSFSLGAPAGRLARPFLSLVAGSIPAIARFYVRSVHPQFEMYVSPLNHDPRDPAIPLSHPASFAQELAEATGLFYTQGMPEDTKALKSGILTPEEFLQQARLAGEEIEEQYKYVLDKFARGFLFYYFGNVDQVSHMMWRSMDPDHPAYDPVRDAPFAGAVEEVYRRMDQIVGYTLEHAGDDVELIVMSDHGFTSWRRTFNLNSWLLQNGYLVLYDPYADTGSILSGDVDWSRTRAYGLGINGLYVNLKGREKQGIVAPEERLALLREIGRKLLETVDPETGQPAVTKVYIREETYHDRGQLEVGPDMIVGYAKGTRCSDPSVLGDIEENVFADNTSWWSGDHCMDHEAVPGILFSSVPLDRPPRNLHELTGTILERFGIDPAELRK